MDTGNDDYRTRLLVIRRRKLAYLECRLEADHPADASDDLSRERWYEERAVAELSDHPRGPARARWRRQRPTICEPASRVLSS